MRRLILPAIIAFVVLLVCAPMLYQVGTQDTLTATVTKTERVCETNKEDQDCKWMVLTDQMAFKNMDALFHWKWNSTDIQSKIAERETYTFHYYGWRIPFLSVYPNLVSVE